MKTLIVILGIVSISFAANAASWRCEGKRAVVALSIEKESLILSAIEIRSGKLTNLVSQRVFKDGIVFDNSGETLENVRFVAAKNHNYYYELNIKEGVFYIHELEKGHAVFTATNLTCNYSGGEQKLLLFENGPSRNQLGSRAHDLTE